MSQSVAYKHWLRVLSQWPKDNLRPDLQFEDAMRRRVKQTFNIAEKTEDGKNNILTKTVVDEKAELEQVNALYSLLDDRYKDAYPLSSAFMKPASKPTYYTDLLAELDAAPKRSRWETFVNSWKGFVRIK